MEEKRHDIKTVFTVGGEEDIKPLREDDPSVVAVISSGETIKSPKPIGTEEVIVQLYVQYEEGEHMDEAKREFKEKIVQTIYDSLRNLEHGGLKVRSVNARIPE